MPKKDFETPRISRIGSFIVPPGAQRFLSAFRFERGSPIKQKAIAQGNSEQGKMRSQNDLVARLIQLAPGGEPPGIGFDQRAIGLESLDALRWRADGFDCLAGDSKPPQSCRTERGAGLTIGKAMDRNVQNV
jgi:hypothetical protein